MSFSGSITKLAAAACYDYNKSDHEGYGDSASVPPSLQSDCEEFQRLLGVEFDFHGAQDDSVRLNSCVYEFLQDPDDGYRSHLGAVKCTPASEHTGYYNQPLARVILVSTDAEETWPDEWVPPHKEEFHDGPFHGYYLVDADDFHIWAQIGTEYHDSYYPCFVTRYNPKPPETV